MNAKSTNQHARQETTDSRKPKETGAGGLAITALAIAAIAVAGYWLWRNVTTGMKGEWIESEETTTTPPDAREQASPTHPFACARRGGENGGDPRRPGRDSMRSVLRGKRDLHAMSVQDRPTTQIVLAFAIFGAIACAVIASLGFVFVVMVLQESFAPPLEPIENFGQFGVLPILYGPIGFLYGLSFGCVPIVKKFPWIRVTTCACLIMLLVHEWRSKAEVGTVAVIIVSFTCVAFGFFLTFLYKWRVFRGGWVFRNPRSVN